MLSRLVAIVLGIAVAAVALPSSAQNSRSFVASTGSDANNCQRITPCRTFAVAYSVTNAGGEIVPLDSAGYGGFTIAKSLIVTVPAGVHAAVGGTVVVNAGVNDTVVLDGLKIEPGGGDGIDIQSAMRVIVRNSRITGANTGISVSVSARTEVNVADTEIFGPGQYGANLSSSVLSSPAVVTFDRVRIDGTSFGVWVADNTLFTARNCVVTGRSKDSNQNYGAILNQPTVTPNATSVVVEDTLIANWYTAFGHPLNSGGNASQLVLRNNTIRSTSNGAFGHPTYLTITSFGDNRFIDVDSYKSGFATSPSAYASEN